MTYAYLPDDGRPARLIRFTTLLDGLIARYDHTTNVVLVDKGYFDALDNIEQGRVLATHSDLRVRVRGGRVSVE